MADNALQIPVVCSPDEYEAALRELDRLMKANPPKDSIESQRLDLLADMLEVYEKAQFPMETEPSEEERTQRDVCADIWTDEDGDRYYANGHRPLEEMQERAIAFEMEMWPEGLDEAKRKSVANGRVWYYWAKDDPDDEERMILVDTWEAGAHPYTELL